MRPTGPGSLLCTRIPETCTVTQQVIAQAWAWGEWQPLDETVKYQRVALGHYGMAQRWLVVSSQDAWQRAAHTLAKAQAKESAQGQQQLLHLQAQRFPSESAARAALEPALSGGAIISWRRWP